MSERYEVGEQVEVRDTFGEWHPAQVVEPGHVTGGSRSHPWPAVKVNTVTGWTRVNWPLEDVRKR